MITLILCRIGREKQKHMTIKELEELVAFLQKRQRGLETNFELSLRMLVADKKTTVYDCPVNSVIYC